MPTTQIEVENIDTGFYDAIRVWTELLEGVQKWGWGPCATQYFFLEMFKFAKVPKRPATPKELAAFKKLADLNDRWKNDPKANFTIRWKQQMDKNLNEVASYLGQGFGVSVNRADFDASQGVPQRNNNILDTPLPDDWVAQQ